MRYRSFSDGSYVLNFAALAHCFKVKNETITDITCRFQQMLHSYGFYLRLLRIVKATRYLKADALLVMQ